MALSRPPPGRAADPRGARPHQHRQDPPRDGADARPLERDDRLPAAAARARELRPHRARCAAPSSVALITGEERILPPHAALVRVHGRGDAAGARVVVPRRRRDPARAPTASAATSSPTGCCTRAAATRRCSSARRPSEPVIRRLVPDARVRRAAAALDADLCRAAQDRAPAAPLARSSRSPPPTSTRIAELVRRQRGGAAVVFGALSPRTRNAQVAMYQAGEVDYLVATDAIGMGLNLDIDHVAFAELREVRRPSAAPACRAPSWRRSPGAPAATWPTARSAPPRRSARSIPRRSRRSRATASRRCAAPRGAAPTSTSPRRPRCSPASSARPPDPVLLRARQADDHLALAALARDDEVLRLADRPCARAPAVGSAARCRISASSFDEAHARLRRSGSSVISPGRRGGCRRTGSRARSRGSTAPRATSTRCSQRIAHVRTWTYVAHRPEWLPDAGGLAGAHARDRGQALRRAARAPDPALRRPPLRGGGEAPRRRRHAARRRARFRRGLVEGERVGRLDGFAFRADPGVAEERRPRAAGRREPRACARTSGERVERLVRADDGAFALDEHGTLRWNDHAVARLVAGGEILAPRIELLPSELLEPAHREALRRRLVAWLDLHLARALAPLWRLRAAPLAGPARGLAFELVAALGIACRRAACLALTAALRAADRQALAGLGVVAGEAACFLPALRDRRSLALRGLLWRVFAGAAGAPPPPPAGLSAPRIPERPGGARRGRADAAGGTARRARRPARAAGARGAGARRVRRLRGRPGLGRADRRRAGIASRRARLARLSSPATATRPRRCSCRRAPSASAAVASPAPRSIPTRPSPGCASWSGRERQQRSGHAAPRQVAVVRAVPAHARGRVALLRRRPGAHRGPGHRSAHAVLSRATC